jgi:hypothetical protein
VSVKDARISTAFPTHPKTKKLMRRLGPGGALACVYLFLWAAANRSDGDLSGLSDEDIELAVDWTGEPGAFVTAAAEVGYLDGEEGQRTIHDWEEHNPWAAGSDLRSDRARWANLIRHHGPEEAARLMPEYAARIGRASGNDPKPSLRAPNRGEDGEIRTPPLPLPSPSPSPRACGEPDKPAAPPPPREPAVDQSTGAPLTIPLADGSEHAITADDLAEYRRLFPGVDLCREILAARRWCKDNPARRKTRKGAAKFVTGWLERAQNSPSKTAQVFQHPTAGNGAMRVIRDL